MGRGRTENKTSRQVTFCNALLIKKAYELSAVVLFNAVVALITVVFSNRGRLHECANNRFSQPIKALSLLSVAVVLGLAPMVSCTTTSWASYCVGGHFTRGSSYRSNLEAVAATLPTRVGSSPLLFASEPATSRGGGEVYALTQCWRLSSSSVCERCVAAAFRDARVFCQSREGAFIFRDKCTVGYYMKKIDMYPDDPSIGVVARSLESPELVIHDSTFEGAAKKLREAVVHGTATSPSYFATGQTEINTTDLQATVYAAAQCLPSMTPQDCDICQSKLLDALVVSALEVTPGRVASVWCSYRHSFYRFFSRQPTLTLPAAEPPMGIDRPPASKHSNQGVPSWVWVAGVGAAVIIVVVAVEFWYKKKRLSRENLPSGERERTVQLEDRTGEEEAPRVYSGQVPESSAPPKPVEEPQHPLPSMAEACSIMDLTAIHQILFTTHYRDDEGSKELSFEGWTPQMRDVLDIRKCGDSAFENKDFRTAINCYSQFVDVGTMVSPTVYARRSLCYLMCDVPDAALRDAMQAQIIYPDWPTAFYMQAIALWKLNMQNDAVDMLNEATQLEEMRRQRNTEVH